MSDWSSPWREMLSVSDAVPTWVLAMLVLACVYCLVILPSGALMSYVERKLSADLQARVGPSHAGRAGLLQPFADFLKLLQKELNGAKPGAGRRFFDDSFWFIVHSMVLYSTVAVLPLGSVMLLVDTDMSAFLPFWATLLLGLGTMLMGLNQFSVPGWFGGIRVAAQALAGAFPALVTILCAGVRPGGFSWSGFAASQGSAPFFWNAFASPFEFLAFVVYVVSGLVLMSVPPLDGGLSLPDLHGGVSSHIHGRRLILFQLGRFYGFFLWSVIAVVLFLGAWLLPEPLVATLRESQQWTALLVLEMVVLLLKTFALMTITVLIGSVTPRLRSDQITDFSWKVLSPVSLFALVGTALWVGWRAFL